METWEQSRMYVLGKIEESSQGLHKLRGVVNKTVLDNTVNLNQQTNILKEELNRLDRKMVKIVTIQNLLLSGAILICKFVFKVL